MTGLAQSITGFYFCRRLNRDTSRPQASFVEHFSHCVIYRRVFQNLFFLPADASIVQFNVLVTLSAYRWCLTIVGTISFYPLESTGFSATTEISSECLVTLSFRCCSSDTSVNTINHTVAESNFSRASNCATGLTISPTRRTDSSNTVISRGNEAVHAAYRSMLCRNDAPSVKRSSNINHHGLVSVPGFRFSRPFHRLSSKPAKIDGYRWLS